MADLSYLFGSSDECATYNVDSISNKNIKCKTKRPNVLELSAVTDNRSSRRYNGKLLTPDVGSSSNNNNGKKCSSSQCEPVKIFGSSKMSIYSLLHSLSCSNLMNLPKVLPPENAEGNTEYKRQLLNLTPVRMQRLTTQLNWRLREGNGEAIYEIGVNDNGTIVGLEMSELVESVYNLCKMAESLNADVTVLREYTDGTKKALEVLVRKLPAYFSAHETRVALLGNMDSGKSTLIGVLTQGILDNGYGKTRSEAFRHPHELRSGRTSSISCQILGFDSSQNVTNFYWQEKRLHHCGHEQIVLSSNKIVALIDLAGSHKYQHTTLFGITAKNPHAILLVIPANHGMKGMSVDHFHLATALRLPIVIVISKIDLYSPLEAIKHLEQWFQSRSFNFEICVIESEKQAMNLGNKIYDVIPVFPVSCVSGDGIGILTTFLGNLKVNEVSSPIYKQSVTEIWIDQTYFGVPEIDGCIVGGLVHTGSVHENDCLYLGPQQNGDFIPVTVQSIHRNRVQQTTVHTGHYGSFAITVANEEDYENGTEFNWLPQTPDASIDKSGNYIRKGMVLLGSQPKPNHNYFVIGQTEENIGQTAWGIVISNIEALHDGPMTVNDLKKLEGCWIVHCGNVYQKCLLVSNSQLTKRFPSEIDKENDVIFQFKDFPQFVHWNCKVVFHKPGQNIKACGSLKILLGNRAINEIGVSNKHQLNNHSLFSFNNISDDNGRKIVSKTSEEFVTEDYCPNGFDDDDDDDEYVTAPNSPILP